MYGEPAPPAATLPPVRRAFTLIELLVVIAVISVLIGILLPALGAARTTARATACAARLQQLGVALSLYFGDFDNTLPQALGPLPGGGQAVIGALFGGRRGTLPFYGIDSIGAAARPLNRYLSLPPPPPTESTESQDPELTAFRSPVDRGAADLPGIGRVESMYTLLGSSYTLNDHDLRGDDFPTLVPRRPDGGGGPMPPVVQPSRTWVIGSHPIYNYESNGDRGMSWYDRSSPEANLLFLDMHARARLKIPPGVVNTTPDYTFLAEPGAE